ncbi:hypothetical protein Cs7R123_32090 [Catellatospora sp. TT07R-123]|uniref:methyltransferase n=1 Tax=Catellatospora sp. TT07R-123 TaxID=2733863 RepID=UPI001B26A36A|nr:methyltransferase [Catellatospora sp. TT07R-123]GHJ45867.1 hypothetical protein Cs7R123_32090 [Catellatospora sp. TT07R-123]
MPPSTLATPAIDERTRELLSAAVVDGNRVRITEQVSAEAYAPVKKILAALGGAWAPAVKATVFPQAVDPAALIVHTLDTGVIPLHPRRAEGFVRTPNDLADRLCSYPHTDLAWLPPSARVLEPSAGDGALVAAILRANPDVQVTAVEPNPTRAAVTATLGRQVDVRTTTLEVFAQQAMTANGLFDAVVMNPPFGTASDPHVWMDHLRMAWVMLRPGASLVAVVPNSIAYRNDAKHRTIRDFIEHHGSHQPLPHDAFAISGTLVTTRLVRMTKPITSRDTDHLLTIPEALPVLVEQPRFTADAATGTPVQVWYDSWRHRDRILRYRGTCAVCSWLLWGTDDGENDPRGILGDFSAGFSLDAAGYDQIGPDVGLCTRCANDADTYLAGLDRAHQHWTPTAELQAAAR